jgi:hypothetical protein
MKSLRLPRRIGAFVAAATLATAGLFAAEATVAPTAEPAQALTCYYRNLTSTKVYNVDCPYGAYAYKTKASASWTRNGDWVRYGKWSYNWSAICWNYATMIWSY